MTSQKKPIKVNEEYLYKQVSNFISKGYHKYLTGSKTIDGYLIFDIGNERSIHINPNLKLVALVDNITSVNTDYCSADNIKVLTKFFGNVFDKIEQFYEDLSRDLAGKIAATLIYPSIDSVDCFFYTELWYYKCQFSAWAGSLSYKSSGIYSFKLADGKILHFIAAGREYLTDKGVYFIEDPRTKVSLNTFEPECTDELLGYLKELCKDPENLKNLASV